MFNITRNSFIVKTAVLIGELVLLNLVLSFLLSLFGDGVVSLSDPKMLIAMINLSYLLSISQVGMVVDRRSALIEGILSKVFKTTFLLGLILLVVILSLGISCNHAFFVYFFVIIFLLFSCWRVIFRSLLRIYRKYGGSTKRVLVLGAGHVAHEVHTKLVTNLIYGYKFLGFYDDRKAEDYVVDASLVLGTLEDARRVIEEGGVDEVICALPSGDDRNALPLFKLAEKNFVKCFIVPDFRRFIKKKVSLSFTENIPLAIFREDPLELAFNRILKRTFDILASGLFLITLFPIIYIVCGLAIKLTSPGPVFFKQKRTGKNGEDFYCWKFRTMTVNEQADMLQATKGDARITKVGAFLRKTNLDEMPQFINAFVGTMSIVGPRPHMVSQTKEYSKLIDEYMVRHIAKPGITGWAQVTGFRGETSKLSQMQGRVERDVWYIENWSFWLDIKIIFMTVFNMIKGDKAAY